MSSSGMWRCVDLALTDVSEERVACIFSLTLDFFPTPDRYPAAYTYTSPCYLPADLQHRFYLSPNCLLPLWPTLPLSLSLSLFLYIWLFPTGGSVCSQLLTLVARSRIFLPRRWKLHVPPKRRLTQDLHSATS
jgi:hypothetical protein